MNERIRELAKQCWDTRPEGQLHFDNEKFAELIVRECINVGLEQKKWVEDMEVFDARDVTWNQARVQQSQRIVDKIKQHFGVEE